MKCDGLRGNEVHKRTALNAGKNRRVDLFGNVLVIGQDQAASRAPQGLMGRGGHDMRVRKRAGMNASRHEAGEMRHIHHQERAN